MKILVIYDSVFGNTKEIAKIIFNNLDTKEKQLLHVKDTNALNFETELLIVGSPTRQFKATQNIMAFIKQLSSGKVKSMKFACFDTRVALDDIDSSFLRFMVNTGGYAAKKMKKALKKRGAQSVAETTGFFVEGQEGPLKTQEKERAAAWAKSIENSWKKS